MRFHPESVERAVFFGMEGPDHTYDHPDHVWNVYKRVAEEAEAVEELKPLIPEGGLIAAITNVMEHIKQEFTKAIFEFAATGDMSGLPDEFEMPPEEWGLPDAR